MDKKVMNLIWGIAVILVGILLLLITTGTIQIRLSIAWLFAFLFFFGFGIFMGFYFAMHRTQFWPLIPGIIMLGLSLLMISSEIGLAGDAGAGLFMIFIALSFLAVYIWHRTNWWAIIPAGMVGSVSLVIFFEGIFGVGLMFLGMGLTFLALYFILMPTPEKHWWPLIPGGILGIMGALFLFFRAIEFGNYVLPIGLIIVGLILIVKNIRSTKASV